MQDTCASVEDDGNVARPTFDDGRLPLSEVLRCVGVPWSARAVSRRFCAELEAGRRALRIRWRTDADPAYYPCGGWARADGADPHRLRTAV